MIITKKCLPRRTVLRGLGASLALPLLDGMVPALSAQRTTAAHPVRRLGVIYMPNGVMMGSWTPAATGSAFELTPTLQPLAPFRDRMVVLTGLQGPGWPGHGGHVGAATRFLTGLQRSAVGDVSLYADVSMDQVIAKELGQYTQLASLELGLDRNDKAGGCEAAFACAYTNTIAWRSPTTPLPMEPDPRAVFERLFGDSGTTDPKARLAQSRRSQSILDSVTGKIARLQRGLGPPDRVRFTEYLEAVRDIERRIQKAEEQSARELPVVTQPAGVPATHEAHAKLMFDLQLLAYQCDLTRVITFMMGNELSGRTFPEIGVAESWHGISHHQNDPVKIASMATINAYQSTLFAYYLERLQATPDGDGSLLDHLMILFGAGMSDSNHHDSRNLPLLLVGGATGQLKGGRHLKYPSETPIANLLVTVMDKFGVPVEKLGTSTGKLEIDSLSLA